MDSFKIAEFINTTYPDPPFTLTSPLGDEIIAQSRKVSGAAFVALPSDVMAADDLFLRRKVPGSKVVLLAGPIHAYGLLKLIKTVGKRR